MRRSGETSLLLDAEVNLGLLTRADAMRHAVAPHVVDHWARSGILERAQPSVYRLIGAPLTWESEVLAAVLAVTDDDDRCRRGRLAAASGKTAARIIGCTAYAADAESDPIEITVSGPALPLLTGDVQVRRTTQLPLADVQLIGSVPCTSGARTGVDLVQTHERIEVPRIADELIGGRHAKRGALHARALALARGRRNVGGLADLTAPGGEAAFNSWLERTAEELFAAAGLPQRVWNVALPHGLGIPDVHFLASGVVVELDGPRFHRTDAQQDRDRRHDRERLIARYLPLRYGYWDVVQRPQMVIDQIRAAIAGRS